MTIHVSKGDTQMANKHMKRCSVSLIIREMQIETTVRCHFTLIRMVAIKTNKQTEKSVGEDVEKFVPLCYCWWESKTVKLLWKTVCQVLNKLQVELP